MCWVSAGCPCFFFQAEDGIRDGTVTGVQTCALPILGIDGATAAAERLQPYVAGGGGALLPARRQRRAVARWRHRAGGPQPLARALVHVLDRKSVVEGQSGAVGGRRPRQNRKRVRPTS